MLRRMGMLLLLMALAAQAGAQCRYSVEIMQAGPCGPLNSLTTGYGINASTGAVVGYYNCPAGPEKAFISTKGTNFTPLTLPPGTTYSKAFAINDAGTILGDADVSAPRSAFIVKDGVFQLLGTLPGGNTSEAGGINSHNVVVGTWGNFVTGPFPLAFRWENGVMQDISQDFNGFTNSSRALGVSDSGLITGYMGNQFFGGRPFIWNNSTVTNLGCPFPECIGARGNAITNQGRVCGIWYKGTTRPFQFQRRGFYWDGETMIDLGVFGSSQESRGLDLNEAGTIIDNATIWQNGVWRTMDSLLVPGSGVAITDMRTISNVGQIAGSARRLIDSVTVAVRLTPVHDSAGDFNCDEHVNVDDLLGVINAWGPCKENPYCAGDFNDDKFVNSSDLMQVIENWD